jgi:prevent-host-death family protein
MRTELVTTLKRKATEIIAEVEAERDPVLITQHGRPAAYLVDVETYEDTQRRLAILEGIARAAEASVLSTPPRNRNVVGQAFRLRIPEGTAIHYALTNPAELLASVRRLAGPRVAEDALAHIRLWEQIYEPPQEDAE